MQDKASDGKSNELTYTRRRRDAAEDAEIKEAEKKGHSDFKQHRGTTIRITCYKFVRWYVSKLKILEYTVYVVRLHAEERCYGRKNKHKVWKMKNNEVINVTHKKDQWRDKNTNENAGEVDPGTEGPQTSRRRRDTQAATAPKTCADSGTCWLRHPDIIVDSSDIELVSQVCNKFLISEIF